MHSKSRVFVVSHSQLLAYRAGAEKRPGAAVQLSRPHNHVIPIEVEGLP